MKIAYIISISLFITIGSLKSQSTTNVSLGGFITAEYTSGVIDASDYTTPASYSRDIVDNELSARISPYCVFNTGNVDQYGIKLDIAYTRTKLGLYLSDDNGVRFIEQVTKGQSYGGSFFYRKYITQDKTINFFLQPEMGINYTFTNVETTIPRKYKNHFVSISVGGRPGLAYDFSEKLKFIATAGIISYNYIIDREDGDEEWNKSHNVDASLSLSSFQIGLEYRL